MVAIWAVVLVASVAAIASASRRAVDSALVVVDRMGWSPAVVGLAVLAVGTDLPEITNSIVSTATGHGDVNVGDSIGSVITQVTLVLGILTIAGARMSNDRSVVIALGAATAVAVFVVWMLLADGRLSHIDGVALLIGWAVGTALLSHAYSPRVPVVDAPTRDVATSITLTLFWLAVVGGLSIAVVESFLQVADALGVPEFTASFVALSVGTSIPELAVDLTAVRRKATTMAIGELFGSSFVDATLSIGVGPALFGSMVSASVLPTVAAVGIGVVATTVLVVATRGRGWRLAILLFVIYGAVYGFALS